MDDAAERALGVSESQYRTRFQVTEGLCQPSLLISELSTMGSERICGHHFRVQGQTVVATPSLVDVTQQMQSRKADERPPRILSSLIHQL